MKSTIKDNLLAPCLLATALMVLPITLCVADEVNTGLQLSANKTSASAITNKTELARRGFRAEKVSQHTIGSEATRVRNVRGNRVEVATVVEITNSATETSSGKLARGARSMRGTSNTKVELSAQ